MYNVLCGRSYYRSGVNRRKERKNRSVERRVRRSRQQRSDGSSDERPGISEARSNRINQTKGAAGRSNVCEAKQSNFSEVKQAKGSKVRHSEHFTQRSDGCEVRQFEGSGVRLPEEHLGCSGNCEMRQGCNASGCKEQNVWEHMNILENSSNDTLKILSDLVKTLANQRSEGNKFPMLGNVIPEFNPMQKDQTVHSWLNKVDECAQLYRWGDDQIIHYALPKLVGVAKVWYQASTMSFSWQEWKAKLIESFPSSDDYAELLTELLSKRVKFNESLELYYYEKLNLLNRCEIKGKRAVDCILKL